MRISINVFGLLVGLVSVFSSCEDRITFDLHDAEPQVVIIGEINNRDRNQEVSIYRTVPVGAEDLTSPVSGATVSVTDGRGRVFVFNEVLPGLYRSRSFRGIYELDYHLSVKIDGEEYTAVSRMPPYVQVDSIGTVSSDFMGEENRFATLKFTDPAGVPNYYRYLLSKEGEPYRYVGVFDDKYNNGRWVTHELFNRDVKLETGDQVRVQRQCIDRAAFQYWRSVSMANPAASAPANPPSNITGGALGYFSAFSMHEYDINIW